MKLGLMFFLVTITLFLFVPVELISQGGLELENPLPGDTFQDFLEHLTNWLFWFGLALVPLFLIIAAFYFLTAGGNPKQIETGKKIILYTLAGLLVIIMASGIVEFLQRMWQ